jgi:hypothetical protein
MEVTMKKVYTVIAMMVLVTILGISSANAQTSGNPRLIASVPFAFNVGNTTLPAGAYTVSFTNPASSAKVLQISRKDGSASVVIQTSDTMGKIQDNAKLVFHRYGDQYFLAQAWMAADSNGLVVQKSRGEKDIQRKLGAVKTTPATVAVNLKR